MANPAPKKTGKETGIKTFRGGQPQPTPEQKKAGRDRKRQAQKIMDEMIMYQNLTEAEFQEFIKQKDTKLGQIVTATYMREIMRDKKIMTHRLDKHIPNAPQEISGPDGGTIDFTNINDEDLLRIILSKK